MNQDRLCVAVANHLEKTFGGWKAPFKTPDLKNWTPKPLEEYKLVRETLARELKQNTE